MTVADRERVHDFIRSLAKESKGSYSSLIEEEAVRDGVPIIRLENRELMRVLIRMHKPATILEVGTAIAYSAVFMAEITGPDTRIDTIENYEPRLVRAREHIKRSGFAGKIRLLEGDAADILPGLTGPYDLIFMDAAKGQYLAFLPDLIRLQKEGGLLLSDNVLQDGDIFESRYALRRRNHTIHHRMREYLYVLTHHELYDTVILESGDGMSVSVRKEDTKEI